MKVGAIIFSRLSSSRFPRKALAALGEKCLLQWCIDGCKELSSIQTILATSNRKEDDALAEIAAKNKIKYFQGDLNDVALRTMDCCAHFELDYFFRINGDSPFLNIPLMQQALELLADEKFDLISNLRPRSYPYGMSCELIKVETFKQAYQSFDEAQKEHITSYYYTNPERFNIAALPVLSQDYSAIRLTVDTKMDLEVLAKWQKTRDALALYYLDSKEFNTELEDLKHRRND